MKTWIARFTTEEFGNAVVDWTVLMTGVVLLAIAVAATVLGDTQVVSKDLTARTDPVRSAPV